MKTLFLTLRTKGASIKVAVAASTLMLATQAHAAIPAWATGMFTELSDDVTSILAVVGPIIMIAVAGFTVIRLIKRGANKI